MKLNGTILFYRPEQNMLPEIPVLCALKKIRCRPVGPEQADLLIGELAGILPPAEAAAEGAAFTKTIIATKGRAAYLGERSLGHVDPGAASFAVIMKTVAESY